MPPLFWMMSIICWRSAERNNASGALRSFHLAIMGMANKGPNTNAQMAAARV
jgi:hypothetical protein